MIWGLYVSSVVFFSYHPLSLKLDSKVLILGIQFGTNLVVVLLCAGNFFWCFSWLLSRYSKNPFGKRKDNIPIAVPTANGAPPTMTYQ